MNRVIAWGAKGAPFFIAVPMAIFGVQHFIYLHFVADFIPAWIPWRSFWACFTGVALIASAAGIVFRVWDEWAAAALGGMILSWVILLHTSRIAANPGDFGEWRGIFQALAMSGCAFVLFESARQRKPEVTTPTKGPGRSLTALPELGARLAPCFVGASTAALGVEHFIFANVTVPQVPVWIPGTTAGNYLAGATLFALGAGILFRRTRLWSSALLGLLIFLSLALVHLPVVLKSSRFESDWTKTLVLSGGAILLAARSRERINDLSLAFHRAP